MKLSLRWIFDHIEGDYKKVDVAALVSKFNQITAEIEHFYEVTFDLENFALCKVTEFSDTGIALFIPEWNKEIHLPKRPDATKYQERYFLVKRAKTPLGVMAESWADFKDFGSDKGGLLPPFYVTSEELKGAWKKRFETDDVILEVDNKSITHRPDMWGR